jgi:hypothetical protein
MRNLHKKANPAMLVHDRRWCVVMGNQYVSRADGKLRWTRNLEEAREIAEGFDGQVVDAEWFKSNWRQYQTTGVIPDEAKPPAVVPA